MAIFQPTNIIPSSFTQRTVDVSEIMKISWQVNGNSAMTAFQIDFYKNDANSTYVISTGKIADYFYQSESGQTLSLPFYGTDRYGKPQFFTYAPFGRTWSQFLLTNGNDYKYKITQFFSAKSDIIYTASPEGALSGQRVLQLEIDSRKVYVIFDFQVESYRSGVVYYNWTKQKGWIITSNRLVSILTTVVDSDPSLTSLGTATLLYSGYREDFVTQTSFSTFITQTTPTLTISTTTSDYKTDIRALFTNLTLKTSIGYFVADYTQEQGDAIRWIRWQIATAKNGIVGEIIADTGDVYTPTLQYEFNGFLNGQQYAIRCLGESENGQNINNPNADSNGWQFFNVSYKDTPYDGMFTFQCLNKENAVLLEWDNNDKVINGVYTPPSNNENYTLQNGSVFLPKKSSITWNKKEENNNEEEINFRSPWTLAYTASLGSSLVGKYLGSIYPYNTDIGAVAFNPAGNILIVGEYLSGITRAYSVNGTSVEYQSTITLANNEPLSKYTTDAIFSPDGKVLVLVNGGLARIFTVNGSVFTYIGTLKWGDGEYPTELKGVRTICFNKNATLFSEENTYLLYAGYVGLPGTDASCFFKINTSSGTATWLTFLTSPDGNLIGAIDLATFSNDGTLLVIHQFNFENNQVLYLLKITKVTDDDVTVTWMPTIKHGESFFDGDITDVVFSPNDKLLIVSGFFTGGASLFTVNTTNATVTYSNDIKKQIDSIDYPLESVYSIAFNPMGTYLVVGGNQNAYLFSVSDSTTEPLKYLFEVTKNGIPLSGIVSKIKFNNADLLVFGELKSNAENSAGEAIYYVIQNTTLNPKGTILKTQDNDILISIKENEIYVYNRLSPLFWFDIPTTATSMNVIITPKTVQVKFFKNGSFLSSSNSPAKYTQKPITSISIYGGDNDNGTKVDSVSVYRGDGSDILYLYNSFGFEPVWSSQLYTLYMTANFNNNINGGISAYEFRIYRQELGKNKLTPIATIPPSTDSIKDYGVSSRKTYQYYLNLYYDNGAIMSTKIGTKLNANSETTIATCFKNYSLLVCDYDEKTNEYHVRKQYLFALNLSNGSVGNNNNPTLNKNFTAYPTRMGDTANYASGTLQGLIGAIYTVPALIEQIGNYKWTSKPSTLDYFDSVDLEKELYDLSITPYQLFLRDMKGRMRMIHTNAPISMTTNIKQKQQSIYMSLPWVEIGDASDVTIIQTSEDYGWNNDNQVLDVTLDVDMETGELTATYPFPYNGTKFFLTGIGKEFLSANTPLGITPAQFNLSNIAEETTDGGLTATIAVNSKNN